MKKIIVFLSAFFFFTSGVAADIIIFGSGSAKEGIIEEETPTSVRLRVKNAVMGFSRSNIIKIEYASDEENRQLDFKWKEQEERKREERRKKKEEKKRFEKEQRAKGLVKDGKDWIPEKRKVELDRNRARRSVEAQQKAMRAEKSAEESEAEEGQGGAGFDDISIKVLDIDNKSVGSVMLGGSVTNKGSRVAVAIFLSANVYGKDGTLIFSKSPKRVKNLAPNESAQVRIPVNIRRRLIERHELVVTQVLWESE